MTASEVERVVRPPSSKGPWRRAVVLATKHRVKVVAWPEPIAWRRTWTVGTPPVVSDELLAGFAHEVGHLIDPEFDDAQVLRGEIVAWTFAIRALDRQWNPRMAASLRECMATYAWALKYPADRRAWAALNELAEYRARKFAVVYLDERAKARAEAAAIGQHASLLPSFHKLQPTSWRDNR